MSSDVAEQASHWQLSPGQLSPGQLSPERPDPEPASTEQAGSSRPEPEPDPGGLVLPMLLMTAAGLPGGKQLPWRRAGAPDD